MPAQSRRRRSPVRQRPAVEAGFEKVADAWTCPIALKPPQVETLRGFIRTVPPSVRQASALCAALNQFLPWWVLEEKPFRLKTVFGARSIAAFQDWMEDSDYALGTTNNYCQSLNQVGRALNDDQDAQWRRLDRTPTRREPPATYYAEYQVWLMFLLVLHQDDPELADGLLGILFLTLGAGVYPEQLTVPVGTDVYRDAENGQVYVRVGSARRIVRTRYQPGILALAERVGPNPLVPKASGNVKAGIVLRRIEVPHGFFRPRVERLVATSSTGSTSRRSSLRWSRSAGTRSSRGGRGCAPTCRWPPRQTDRPCWRRPTTPRSGRGRPGGSTLGWERTPRDRVAGAMAHRPRHGDDHAERRGPHPR
jgi:hypothetical protein